MKRKSPSAVIKRVLRAHGLDGYIDRSMEKIGPRMCQVSLQLSVPAEDARAVDKILPKVDAALKPLGFRSEGNTGFGMGSSEYGWTRTKAC